MHAYKIDNRTKLFFTVLKVSVELYISNFRWLEVLSGSSKYIT